jgi:two-component system chemotaxis response regulator CheY
MSTVLVVDDEADIRLLCRLILEGGGFEVLQAESAEAALEVLHMRETDYVLLDIRMPGMGGWEMLEYLHGDKALMRTKVIVCSAHAGPADERRATLGGAHAFLAKPFMPADLLSAVGQPAA